VLELLFPPLSLTVHITYQTNPAIIVVKLNRNMITAVLQSSITLWFQVEQYHALCKVVYTTAGKARMTEPYSVLLTCLQDLVCVSQCSDLAVCTLTFTSLHLNAYLTERVAYNLLVMLADSFHAVSCRKQW
jgi:hypothetical protein